jgi:hypothetical protein
MKHADRARVLCPSVLPALKENNMDISKFMAYRRKKLKHFTFIQ